MSGVILSWLGEWFGGKILDKLTEFGIGEFISRKILITPKRIEFVNSDWTSKQYVIISNTHTSSLFSIYILGTVSGGDISNLQISIPNNTKGVAPDIYGGELCLNILKFDGTNKKLGDIFVIKISGIEKESELKFTMKSDKDMKIKLKLLSYKNEPEEIREKPGSTSVPIKFPFEFTMKRITFLLKK